MAGVRGVARDPRLVVLPVIGLFAGVIAGLFLSDAASAPQAAVAAPIRPPAVTVPSEPVRRVARPTRIEIPAIDVSARIGAVGLNADGSMEVPDFGFAGWYTGGPRPGQPGPAVVVAHVDSQAGPDVFYRLRDLRAGDRIIIRRVDGTSDTWRMVSSEQTPKDALPVERIWAPTTAPVLRLVTCGGQFNTATRHYEDNVIVYADPV